MEEILPNSGIYQIRNILDNKVYIGSAMNFKKRKSHHFNTLKKNNHHNIHLQRAFNKYGRENFVFEILYRTNLIDELLEKEDYYIKITNCLDSNFGYNICQKAGSTRGTHPSDESRKRMSNKSKGRPKSEETRRKMKLAWKNKVVSEEEKERLRNLNVGRKFSEEAKANMGKWFREGIYLGSKNPMAKLTEEIVYEIKKMIYEGHRNVDIAKVFDISHKHVSEIRCGKNWRHVIYEPES